MENKSVKELISDKESIDNVLNNQIRKKLFEIALSLQKQVLDETNSPSESIDYANYELFRLTNSNISTPILKVNSILSQAIDQIEKAAKDKKATIGISSGYDKLDEITQGWQASELIVIAAQRSMGKTSFALSTIKHIYHSSNKTIAYFSLELSSLQLTNRLISIETEISIEKIQNGSLDDNEWGQLEINIKNIEDAPLYIDNTSSISIFELQNKCRRLALCHGELNLIVVDYLQLLTTGNYKRGNKDEEVDTIFRVLKDLSTELNVPIVVLSQLSKSVEERLNDKRPRISDISEADLVEKYADKVLFLYGLDCYNTPLDNNDKSFDDATEVIVAKNSGGRTSSIKLSFNKEVGLFQSMS